MSHKVSYSKLFTPPKFLEMPSVSLEILSDRILFLSLKNTEKGLIPEVFGHIPLAEGVVSQGEIIKKDVVIKALIEIRKKVKVSFVRFSIPEEKTYIFKIKLPKLQPKEIRDVLDFKIEENVPLTSKEAVFDFDILPKSKDEEELDIVVSVSPLSFIEEMQTIFELAGLTPVLFSPESNNIARAVVKELNEQVLVIANIKDSAIVFSLVISGIVCQTSSINFGGNTFTESLAKHFKISNEEAVKMKREKLYVDNPANTETFSYLINTISAIKDELYKFISYCNEREDVDSQVDRVILCGQDAMIVGLEKYLSLNLNIKVDVGNIWVNNFDLDVYVPEIDKIESGSMAVVNGLNLF